MWPAALEAAKQPSKSTTWVAALIVVVVRDGGDLTRTRRLGAIRFAEQVRKEVLRRGKRKPCLCIVRNIFKALSDPPARSVSGSAHWSASGGCSPTGTPPGRTELERVSIHVRQFDGIASAEAAGKYAEAPKLDAAKIAAARDMVEAGVPTAAWPETSGEPTDAPLSPQRNRATRDRPEPCSHLVSRGRAGQGATWIDQVHRLGNVSWPWSRTRSETCSGNVLIS